MGDIVNFYAYYIPSMDPEEKSMQTNSSNIFDSISFSTWSNPQWQNIYNQTGRSESDPTRFYSSYVINP